MTPQESQRQLEELKKIANELQYIIPKDWLIDPLKNADKITDAFVKWDDELKEIKRDLGGLNSILKANLQDLTKSNIQLNQSRKATRDLSSISQTLINEKRGILNLDQKQLEKLKQQTQISNLLLQQSINSGELSEKELMATEDNLRLGKELLDIASERLELEKEINKTMGVTGALATGLKSSLNKLGFNGLSERLGIDDALSKSKDFTKNLVEGQKEAGVRSNVMVNGFKSAGNLVTNLGKNLLKSLGPVALIAGLVDALLSLDKTSGEIAKNFGISYDQARGINSEINAIAFNTGNVFIDAQKLNQSFLTLSEALGTNTMLSKELLVDFTQLTEQAGYSVEAATTLSKLSLVTNKSSKELASNYLGQIKLLNIKNGLAINEKTLLNDISNVSKGTLVTLSKNPQELAKAAFEAKKVGLELKAVEGIGQSLLDIENSIGAEFEAEVMTGKALNLERARYYALTNDIAGLAQEINQQGITSEKYAKMNVLQQESYAKALGMSRDELGNMLMEQEAIRAVGVKGIEDLKKQHELAKAQGKEQEFLNKLGNEQYANQLKSNSAQEKFQATLTKLQDIFTQVAEPLLPILSLLGDIFTILGPIGTLISKNIAPPLQIINLLVQSIMDGLKYIFTLGKSDFSNTKAAFGGLKSSLNNSIGGMIHKEVIGKDVFNIQDGQIDSNGGLVVSGPKGSIQMDKEDSFIGNKNGITAGTNLFKNSTNDGNITVLSNTLGNKMDMMINKLDNLIGAVNKGMIVNLDGNKVSQELSTPMAIANRKI